MEPVSNTAWGTKNQREKRSGYEWERRWGEVERWKAVFRLYCMRKELIFNKKENTYVIVCMDAYVYVCVNICINIKD